jgi:hypothetical protein
MAAQIFDLHHYRRMSCDPLLWSEGMKTSEILGRRLGQYDENCMAQKNVVEKFKHGRNTLDYEERSDGVSISRKDDRCAEERKQITVSEIP